MSCLCLQDWSSIAVVERYWMSSNSPKAYTHLPTGKHKDGHFAQIACWVILSENVKLQQTNCTLMLLECFCIPSIPDGLKLFFWTCDWQLCLILTLRHTHTHTTTWTLCWASDSIYVFTSSQTLCNLIAVSWSICY